MPTIGDSTRSSVPLTAVVACSPGSGTASDASPGVTAGRSGVERTEIRMPFSSIVTSPMPDSCTIRTISWTRCARFSSMRDSLSRRPRLRIPRSSRSASSPNRPSRSSSSSLAAMSPERSRTSSSAGVTSSSLSGSAVSWTTRSSAGSIGAGGLPNAPVTRLRTSSTSVM